MNISELCIRRPALVFVLAMALVEGRGREVIGWAIACVLLAAVLALHAHAVAAFVRPLDPVSPGWSGQLGFGFFVKTMTLLTALDAIPLVIGSLLVALALFGWASLPDPVAPRAVAVFGAYAALIALFCRTDTYYWGLLIAPIILIGLALTPDALRDLAHAALDRRRVTVTRIVRTNSPETQP